MSPAAALQERCPLLLHCHPQSAGWLLPRFAATLAAAALPLTIHMPHMQGHPGSVASCMGSYGMIAAGGVSTYEDFDPFYQVDNRPAQHAYAPYMHAMAREAARFQVRDMKWTACVPTWAAPVEQGTSAAMQQTSSPKEVACKQKFLLLPALGSACIHKQRAVRCVGVESSKAHDTSKAALPGNPWPLPAGRLP